MNINYNTCSIINAISASIKKKTTRNYYVFNAKPRYIPPKENTNPPRIIHAIRKAARENHITLHPLWKSVPRKHPITHQLIHSTREINLHRKNAIHAIMECLAAHVNLATGKVFMTLSQISDACGLTTYNRSGIPCYSRASRAINEHIEAIGAISCERLWDNTTGSYLPNIIWVTKIFFELINYEYGKFLSAQKQQLAWENKKYIKLGCNPMSLMEAKVYAKTQHIKRAFEYRTQKKVFNKQIRRARKLSEMNENIARHHILKDIIKLYSVDELHEIGFIKLKKLIEQRYYSLYKLAQIYPNIPPD